MEILHIIRNIPDTSGYKFHLTNFSISVICKEIEKFFKNIGGSLGEKRGGEWRNSHPS